MNRRIVLMLNQVATQLGLIIISGLALLAMTSESNIRYQGQEPFSIDPGDTFVYNEILIGLKPEVIQALDLPEVNRSKIIVPSLDEINEKYQVQEISLVFEELDQADPIAEQYGMTGIFRLTVPYGTDIFAMIADYRRDPAVEYAELNLLYRIAETPNDSDFKLQWGLNNTGQTGGKVDADIDAPEAWDLQTGQSSVMIAIVDTGVDYNHPELMGGRVRTEIDRDFINNDEDAMDDHGHGTYVAGIAAANTNNAMGIAGVCRGCQILPVKVLSSGGEGSAASVAQGIQYAAQAGADIISMSLGAKANCGCSQTIARAINYAYERGSLLIAASGNDYNKKRISYPGSSPRVVDVGATDNRDKEAAFSNRNKKNLDVRAPGVDVYSLDLGSGYRTASGTSAATPHVSGAAGLVWSARPELTNNQVWWLLKMSAEVKKGKLRISKPAKIGRLNVYNALTMTDIRSVAAPVDTCNTELNCPPGCGAEVALVGDATVIEDLFILRNFREQVLMPSKVGQRWVELYYRNQVEVATMLISDAALRTQTRSVLQQLIPFIDVYMNDHGEQVIIRAEDIEAMEGVISGLEGSASPGLYADLQKGRRVLDELRKYIGQDAREVWKRMK